MNVAGAMARGMRSDGGLDLDLLLSLLTEAASALPALAVAGETESQSDEAPFVAVTGGISAEEVASRLIDPRFAELAAPLPLSDFIARRAAGIPLLTEEEIDTFLTDVDERDPAYTRSWLEFGPMEDGTGSWVAYPQSTSTSVDFHLILPVAQEGDQTRLLALDPGLNVMSKTSQPPAVVKGTGCDPGVTGYGSGLREVCIAAGCSGACRDKWKIRRGKMRLTGCDC